MIFVRAFGAWLLERLEEKSTYVGFAVWGIVLSHNIPPEWLEAISYTGSFIATGLIAASTKK